MKIAELTQGEMDLLRLVVFLEDEVPEENFDMSFYVKARSVKALVSHACGTSACVGGWAGTIPEFNDRGLRLDDQMHGNEPFFMLFFHEYTGAVAFAEFFDIEHDEALAIVAVRLCIDRASKDEKAAQIQALVTKRVFDRTIGETA